MITDAKSALFATTIARLRAALPGQVVVEAVEEWSHDRSHHEWTRASAVVLCTSTDDVSAAVAICHTAGVSVVPRGTGTGLEGGANARVSGANPMTVVVDVSGLKRIVSIEPTSLDATVEAGVLRSELNPALKSHGLFFPVGPGVDASIGGMAATRASGTDAVRYGTMREAVLGLTVVLADGSVARTGGRARKSSAGYDLTHLFVGSEGTLGIITEVTVRTYGIPDRTQLSIYSFAAVAEAACAVQRGLADGLTLARAELLDEAMAAAMNAFSDTGFVEAPTLLVEFAGDAETIDREAERMRAIALRSGATTEVVVTDASELAALWRARHNALPAAAALIPGAQTWSTDVCVPLGSLADCIAQTTADIRESGILAPIAGHVGDGNFHLAIVLRPDDSQQRSAAEGVYQRLITRAIAMGGTCTGEHGVGIGKVADLEREHPSGTPLMRAIKNALDPSGILNPEKVLA